MFVLIMTYCLVGKPCVDEAVAYFPQWDVGQHICGLAKPAIEQGVGKRTPAGTRVSFVCREEDDEPQSDIPQAPLNAPKGATLYNGTDNVLEQATEFMRAFQK